MAFIIEAFAFILLVIGIISLALSIKDARAKRLRLQSADVQDGMPDEIQDLPSREDGSTAPE